MKSSYVFFLMFKLMKWFSLCTTPHNAKKEVAFNDHLHGMKLETAEDAESMMDALKDTSKQLAGGRKSEVKRKHRSS